MMRWHCLSVLTLLLTGPAFAAEPLRVAWGAHNAPPYAIVEREQLTGGIIFDVGQAVAGRLGTTATFIEVPRARYEAQLRGGKIDVTCMTNPQWLQDPDSLAWSPPLFEEADILVQQQGSSPWRSLNDLAHRRIGTIHAYRYPTLESLFATGKAQRDDGANLDGNMRRLVLGRLDGLVDADIPIRYWMRTNNLRDHFVVAKFEVSRHNVHCAISPLTRNGVDAVRAVFNEITQDGSLRRIIGKYTENPY